MTNLFKNWNRKIILNNSLKKILFSKIQFYLSINKGKFILKKSKNQTIFIFILQFIKIFKYFYTLLLILEQIKIFK